MPIRPTTPEGPPLTPETAERRLMKTELPAQEVLEACQDQLAGASDAAGLIRYAAEQRDRLGVTSTRHQIKLSFEILRLLGSAPEILPFLDRARPERFEQVIGLRLYGAQCRRALAPVLGCLEAAELLLRGQMTGDCDQIEDHFTARLRDQDTPPEVRLRLSAKFDDPLRLRQLFEESMEERRARRGRRRQLRAGAEQVVGQMKARVEDREKLKRLGRPEPETKDRRRP